MTPEALPVTISKRLVNGIHLEVAEAGPTTGQLVILLHGFPDLWQGWHLQIAPLVAAGFRVLIPNQRGYGDSDKPSGISAYDIELLAQDIVALADLEGRSKFQVVGHDWGGIVAWWMAARYPQRVQRLVVMSAPHPGVFKSYLLRSPSQMCRSWYVGFFQLPWLPESLLSWNDFALLFRAVRSISLPHVFDESDRRYMVAAWSKPGALSAMLNYYRAITRRSERSMRLRIVQPTLILTGSGDPAEEPELVRASGQLCDDYRLIELREARHWIQREEAPRVNQELLAFLSSS
jgi:epoxide hydrolase 4